MAPDPSLEPAVHLADARRAFVLQLLDAGPGVTLADLLQRRPSWHADAACADVDPGVFFPGPGEPTEPAKAVCAGCAVRGECLGWALDQPPALAGIWAGTTRQDRQRLARRRPAA